MAIVQQKKLNKGFVFTFLMIAAIVIISMLDVSVWVKLGLTVAVLAIFVFIRRGFIYFYQGTSLLQIDENNPVVAKRFKKAVRAKVGEEQQVVISSYFINKTDDFDYGITLLEKLSGSKNSSIANYAKVSLSMGYNRIGQTDKAIGLLEELLDSGYQDSNLYVNLTTYLLEKTDTKQAKKYLNRAKEAGVKNTAIMDNHGWLHILLGEWDKAKKIYDSLVNDTIAHFPDAYVHAAQTFLHFEKKEDSLNCLGWAKAQKFSKLCVFSKDYIDKLMLGIENPATSNVFIKAMNENSNLIACGKEFEGLEKAIEFDGERFEVAPQNKEKEEKEREPNTDL